MEAGINDIVTEGIRDGASYLGSSHRARWPQAGYFSLSKP